MVARETPEGVREGGIAAGVVEGVPRLVEEALVIVQTALGARDEMDDGGRIGGDDAGARVLLRAVLEVEPDVLVGGEIEAEPRQRLEADRHRALLRVDGRER